MAVLRRFFGAVFFFGAPVFLLGIACAVIVLYPLFGPIDPENIDRELLAPLMLCRDFRKLPAPVVAELAERYNAEFGRQSGEMPEFHFSNTEKKVYASFAKNKTKSSGSRFETNLNLLARTKFFKWMDEFDSLPPSKRPKMINEIIDDMTWWEDISMSFLRAAELPIPTTTQLMKDSNDMIESFKVGADTKDVERIDRFAGEIYQEYFRRIFK